LRCDRDVNIVWDGILNFDKVHAASMEHVDGRPGGRDILNRDEHRHLEGQWTLDERT
jgi:hypothetical protein